jgi:hypothetical protein
MEVRWGVVSWLNLLPFAYCAVRSLGDMPLRGLFSHQNPSRNPFDSPRMLPCSLIGSAELCGFRGAAMAVLPVTADFHTREAHHIKFGGGSGRLGVEQRPLFRGAEVFFTLTGALAASSGAQVTAESKASYRDRTEQDHGGNSDFGRDTKPAQARDPAGPGWLRGLFQSSSGLVLLLGERRSGRS